MARPQSVGGGRPIRVSTALSRGEMEALDRLRGGMKVADYLRVLINREAARQDSRAVVEKVGTHPHDPFSDPRNIANGFRDLF